MFLNIVNIPTFRSARYRQTVGSKTSRIGWLELLQHLSLTRVVCRRNPTARTKDPRSFVMEPDKWTHAILYIPLMY